MDEPTLKDVLEPTGDEAKEALQLAENIMLFSLGEIDNAL